MSFLRNISIGHRVYSLVVIGMIFIVSLAAISIRTMTLVGGELSDISEKDLPLTLMLQNVTVHQLEQAILTERVIMAIELTQPDPQSEYALSDLSSAFKKLADKVDAEILEAEELAKKGAEGSYDAATAEEFRHILDELRVIETAHKTFDKHVLELMAANETGLTSDEVHDLEKLIHKEEEALDKSMEGLLFEISEFTQRASQRALADEQFGLYVTIIVAIVAAIIMLVLGILIARSVIRPVSEATNTLQSLTDGDLGVDRIETFFNDEIGVMNDALDHLREQLKETKRIRAIEEAGRQKRAQNQEELNQLVGIFGASIGGIFERVSTSSEQMASQSANVHQDASNTVSMSAELLQQTDQTSKNAQQLSAATEEMVASIQEIARQSKLSSDIANKALEEAEQSASQVKELTTAADQIGAVVGLITDIAEQTNLLALNATIEAARAGEAGKGFAVVASEVKNLANQTSSATSEISSQIEGIQSATQNSVDAIQSISDIIGQLSEYSTAIAYAISEQESTTSEMSQNVSAVAEIAMSVSDQVGNVRGQAENSERLSSDLGTIANNLYDEASGLTSEIDTFLNAIRNVDASDDGAGFAAISTNLSADVQVADSRVEGKITEMAPSHLVFTPAINEPAGTPVDISIHVNGKQRDLKARVSQVETNRVLMQLPLNHQHLEEMRSMIKGVSNGSAIAAE
jgi:methyl-accepting chemotaxis protein